MNPILKNILAVILGWIGGSALNMSMIKIGQKVYPIEGIDPTDMTAMAEVMPTLGNEHFLFPFLAHVFGVLLGSVIAGYVAHNHKMKFSLGIGALFLLGAIAVTFMLPVPTWFAIVDLTLAYIPVAWIGGRLAQSISKPIAAK